MSDHEAAAAYQPPENMEFDPREYGLYPENVPGDAWLIRESGGNRRLMDLILSREQLGNLRLSRGIEDAAFRDLMQVIELRMNEIRENEGLPPRP